tara:strand:- start:167 stop:646 length:480 start_codon:yes stop_codon:yes gene_type:complete
MFGAVAAGALVLTPTAIFAEDAVAPANMNVAAASVSTLQVQFVDAHNRTANDARTLAADASHNKIAIVVWGGNRTIQQEAYNAARDLVGAGIPTAFVLAPDGNGSTGDAYMQVYAASTPRTEATFGTNYAHEVRADLRNAGLVAYREAFPAQVAALSLR